MPGKRVAIVQSSYIPWKGYFDLIAGVDEFVLYDDVQYTRRDWRNRNRIKTPAGPRWLTIAVNAKGRYRHPIDEIEVSDARWPERHWDAIRQSYSRAPCFEVYEHELEQLYLETREPLLSRVNERFLRAICRLLGISTAISRSDGHAASAGRTARLVALCQRAGATDYVSGPAAKDYLEEDLFAEAGIAVTFVDYGRYREYPQLYPPFEHRVSIVDLLLHTGQDAPSFMKHVPPIEVHRS
jgi:WbqC-like protein family